MARSVEDEDEKLEQLEKRALELKAKEEKLKKRLASLQEENEALLKEHEALSKQKSKKKENQKTSRLNELKDQLETLQKACEEKQNEKVTIKSEEKKPKQAIEMKDDEELLRKFSAIIDIKEELEFKLNEVIKENEEDKIMFEIQASLEEIKRLEEKINDYNLEFKRIQNETQEIKDCIEREIEQKALLSAELMGLKLNESEGQDGKSLFSEVEDKRQKNLSQLKTISNYYDRLKGELAAKQNELSKLNMEKSNLQAKLSQDSEMKKINDKIQDACYSRIEEIDEFIKRTYPEFSAAIYGGNKLNTQKYRSFLDKYKEETRHYESLKRDFNSRFLALNGQVRILSSEIKKLTNIQDQLLNQKLNMEPEEPQSELNDDLENPTDRKTLVSFADGTKN